MAAFALGIWAAMGDKMVLFWLHNLIVRFFPKWMTDPLATCPRCMCSFWGIVALVFLGLGVGISYNFELHQMIIYWPRVVQIPFIIVLAVGLQEMLHRP